MAREVVQIQYRFAPEMLKILPVAALDGGDYGV
jgi:hypothetical protein